MADNNPLSFIFDQNDPNVNMQLRQRIALAMLAKNRGAAPKNFGEGLNSFGHSIADALIARGEMRRSAAAEAAGQKALGEFSGSPSAPSAPRPYASTGDEQPSASPVVRTIQSQHPDMLQSPPPLTTTPAGEQPAATLFSPDNRMPGVNTAQQPSSMLDPRPMAAPPQMPPIGGQASVMDGGFNSLDAGADAPQPGAPGVTPANFANVRYNNPGAAYPGKDADAFGSTGTGVIGGGHKIAQFPSPVHGAAANMSLLERNYTGMPVSAAVNKWSGGSRNTAPGFDPNTVITPEMARDPRLLQAITSGEAPGKYPMSPEQWQMASRWAAQGGAPPGEGGPRNAVASALMAQQQPPAGLPPEITTGRSAPAAPPQQLAFNGVPTAPPGGGIRAAPQAAPIKQMPPPQPGQQPQATPGAGYVLTLPPKPTAPPIMTEAMARMQDRINRAPPAEKEAVARYLAPLMQNEQAKIARQETEHKDAMIQYRALELEMEKQNAASDKDRREARKDAQGLIKEDVTAPTVGPDPRLGTPQSPQRTGVPAVDPVPPGIIPSEWAKAQSDKVSKEAAGLEAAKPELAETLDLMNKVRSHPAKEASMGTLGGLAKLTPSGQGFAKLNEQLQGKNLVAAYQKIKGTGPVGEREGENIAKAQAALSTATTLQDYNDALDTLENTLRGAVERSERKMRQPVTAWQKSNEDRYAPDIGEVDTFKDGKRREYIGGDPRNIEKSWKLVR